MKVKPAVPSLYKYLSSKYLEAFLSRGEVLFRALSYFRHYEELEVRGDRHEGVLLFSPSKGLEVRKSGAHEVSHLPMAFEAKVQDREIFVFCLSTCRSPELAAEFNADVCVELTEPESFVAAIQQTLVSRPSLKSKRLVHGLVTYYEPEAPPWAKWAVPEYVALSKLAQYKRQAEYRLAFGRRHAFDVSNVKTQLTSTHGMAEVTHLGHPKTVLAAGTLGTAWKVHAFP
jgi:hypothetical protein